MATTRVSPSGIPYIWDPVDKVWNIQTPEAEAQINAGIEAQSPWLGYAQRFGLTGDYWSPAQQYKASLYDPWASAYNMAARLAGLGGQFADPGLLSQFVSTPQNAYGAASGALRNLFGLTPEQRQRTSTRFEGGSEQGMGANAELQALLQAALTPRRGAAVANWLQSRIPEEQSRWRERNILGEAESGMTFLDYLKQRFNLSF